MHRVNNIVEAYAKQTLSSEELAERQQRLDALLDKAHKAAEEKKAPAGRKRGRASAFGVVPDEDDDDDDDDDDEDDDDDDDDEDDDDDDDEEDDEEVRDSLIAHDYHFLYILHNAAGTERSRVRVRSAVCAQWQVGDHDWTCAPTAQHLVCVAYLLLYICIGCKCNAEPRVVDAVA